MVYIYGIPSHLLVTKQQSCFYSIYWLSSALLEYLNRLSRLLGSKREPDILLSIK